MRKPSRIDLLALVAVIVGTAAWRWYVPIEWHSGIWESGVLLDDPRSKGVRAVHHVVEWLTPAVFGLAAVGLARALREPMPGRASLFRQPGVAACAAIVAALAAGAMNTAVWTIRWLEFSEPWLTPAPAMLIDQSAWYLGPCVLAVWAFLAVAGVWMPGRNWVNRLGWAIGSLAVVGSVLRWLT